MSVETWSLRLRPVCRRLPASPILFGEAAFDIHVDIFQIQRPGNRSFFDFCYNLGHALTDGGEVVFAQNARLCQHLRVCQRALDVPFCQSFVKSIEPVYFLTSSETGS